MSALNVTTPGGRFRPVDRQWRRGMRTGTPARRCRSARGARRRLRSRRTPGVDRAGRETDWCSGADLAVCSVARHLHQELEGSIAISPGSGRETGRHDCQVIRMMTSVITSPMSGSPIGAPRATTTALQMTPSDTNPSTRAWLPSAIRAGLTSFLPARRRT